MSARHLGWVYIAALAMLAPAELSAGTEPETFHDWWHRTKERFFALGRRPEVTPPEVPEPVAVSWGRRKLGSLEVGEPVLDIELHDVNDDGKAELLVLTTERLLVVDASRRRAVRVMAAEQLPGERAGVRVRDPVGLLTVTGDEVRVRTSEQKTGARLRFEAGKLQLLGEFEGFPICGSATARLATGRNYFDGETVRWNGVRERELPGRFFVASCLQAVDPKGEAMEVFAYVGTDRTLHVSCISGDRSCRAGPVQDRSYAGAGVAFHVADIDRDGFPEVIKSKGQAPGEPDRVTVLSRVGDSIKRVYAPSFQSGVVALGSGNLDGAGADEVIAAVRLVGSKRVDLWALNR